MTGRAPVKEAISASQLWFLLVGFVVGVMVMIAPGLHAGHDAWIALAIGFGEGLLIVLIYVTLLLRFRGLSLVQILTRVFGKPIGLVFSILFIWYTLHLASLVLNTLTDFWVALVYPSTPVLFIMAFLLVPCALAARSGIEVIARCSQVLVPVMIVSLFLTALLAVPLTDFRSFLPVGDASLRTILWSAHNAAVLPFGETIVFGMIISTLNSQKRALRVTILGLAAGAGLLAVMAIMAVGVLGPELADAAYPWFSAVRLINIGDVLTRVEVLVVSTVLSMGFVELSVLLYAASAGITQAFGLRQPFWPAVACAFVVLGLSTLNATNAQEILYFANSGYPVYAPLFQVGIPVLAHVVATIRRSDGGKRR